MSKSIEKCERCVVSTCQGELVEPIKNYNKYAYWCGIEQNGWKSQPCKHYVK